MRILHVIDDLQLGGAERNLVSLIAALPNHKHHVVHLLDGTAYAPELASRGASIEFIPARRPAEYPRAIQRLRALSREFDVVHTQRWVSDLIGRIAAAGRSAIVTTVQTTPYEPSILARYPVKGRIAAAGVWALDVVLSRRAADLVVGVSDHVQTTIVRRLRVPTERTRRVYNAIDCRRFTRASDPERAHIRTELGLTTDDVAVVTVGHVIPTKGQHLLVETLPGLLRIAPHAVLLVAGEGTDVEPLQRRAVALGVADRVRWLGLRADIARLLGAVDVFALASELEGLPLSVVEAMASSLPCVLSPIAPHRELARLVAEDSAWPPVVAARQEPGAWCDALAPLILEPALRQRCGQSARKSALRHFDASVTAPAMARVFEEAIDRFARRS
jgi:glycosyltransferase involved in cell wall biosynthesis